MAWRLVRSVRTAQRTCVLAATLPAGRTMLKPGGSHAANTERGCVVVSCNNDALSTTDASPALSGSSRTFYKRELPCPPATAFSSAEGTIIGSIVLYNMYDVRWALFLSWWCTDTSTAVTLCPASFIPPSYQETRPPCRQASVCGGACGRHAGGLLQACRAVQDAGRACLLRPGQPRHGAQRLGRSACRICSRVMRVLDERVRASPPLQTAAGSDL